MKNLILVLLMVFCVSVASAKPVRGGSDHNPPYRTPDGGASIALLASALGILAVAKRRQSVKS